MKKIITLLAIAISMVCQTAYSTESDHKVKAAGLSKAQRATEDAYWANKPPSGVVPDKETAIAIADIILSKIYGRAQIQSERPFNVKLKADRQGDTRSGRDFWQVTGSLPKPPPGMSVTGGVAVIEIYKKDGRIRRVFHED